MTNTRASVSKWSPLVEQIAAESEAAVEELYKALHTIRLFLRHQIGPDRAQDAYHNLIIDLVRSIRKGALREPEALPAYAMTIARGKVCSHIKEVIRERRAVIEDRVVLTCVVSESPEQLVLRLEREAIAKRVLKALPARHREILIRFYLKEESAEEIQASMGISDTQFRLIKSRAKLRYQELVQQSMNRNPNRKPAQSASGMSEEAIA